jgi:hypothetical protein
MSASITTPAFPALAGPVISVIGIAAYGGAPARHHRPSTATPERRVFFFYALDQLGVRVCS